MARGCGEPPGLRSAKHGRIGASGPGIWGGGPGGSVKAGRNSATAGRQRLEEPANATWDLEGGAVATDERVTMFSGRTRERSAIIESPAFSAATRVRAYGEKEAEEQRLQACSLLRSPRIGRDDRSDEAPPRTPISCPAAIRDSRSRKPSNRGRTASGCEIDYLAAARRATPFGILPISVNSCRRLFGQGWSYSLAAPGQQLHGVVEGVADANILLHKRLAIDTAKNKEIRRPAPWGISPEVGRIGSVLTGPIVGSDPRVRSKRLRPSV